MTAILGISAFYHDSAAALVVDGRIVAAAQEERFTRRKHDHEFPVNAIDYCLAEAGLKHDQLDYVGFYDKPLLKFDRLLETYLAFAPAGFRSFLMAMPLWLKQKLHLPRVMRKALKGGYKKRFIFTEHHESHAASAFFPSPFEEAAILTLDGVGEWATASFGVGKGNRIEITHEQHFPHSIGLLYSAFTYFTGFRVNSGEYKLMGLAPYGEPKYFDLMIDNLLDLKEDGSFRMDMSYFNYCQGLTMTGPKMDKLFGRGPRKAESPVSQDDMDIAASIQKVTEEVMLRSARHVHAKTGMKNLVMAGGVALNCVGNGRVLRDGPFENVWIQPAAGDAGGALGVALFTWHQLLNKPRDLSAVRLADSKPASPGEAVIPTTDLQSGSFLGPSYTNEEIRAFLDQIGAKYHFYAEENELCDRVAELMANEKVVGWVHGRMEFGPRALGGRSIIGDARSEKMQSVMNVKIKFRESFRPFAPCILKERVSDYFDMRPNEDSPYMLLVAPVKDDKRLASNGEMDKLFGIDKLKVKRSVVPAITHVDYSARVQTVDPIRHPRYHKLIQAFEKRTGCPVIINTSFNVRGEPIVLDAKHAYRCFMATNMDVLVLENCVLLKQEQPDAKEIDAEAYLKQFALD
ncbi:MAG: carbamoyltransferase [Phycisphaeraceae bacterium]